MAEFFDTHVHLDSPQYRGEVGQVISRARAAGVGWMINVGYDGPSSRRSVQLAEQWDGLFAAVGYHPHDACGFTRESAGELRQLAGNRRVVAIGEIGLDFYRNLSPRPAQEHCFRRQLHMARELNTPVIIHDRDAHLAVLEILQQEPLPAGGVLHCFSGDWSLATQFLELGFYLGLDGPVTFSNGSRAQEVARRIPLDRLLLETDSPYLTPVPHRGQRNEPAYVTLVAQQVARLRGVAVEEIAARTRENAWRLFRLAEVTKPR